MACTIFRSNVEKEKFIVIREKDQLKQLVVYLKDPSLEFVAYDIETTGLEKESRIIGFSVCGDTDKAYYVILYEWNVELNKLLPVISYTDIKSIIELLKTKKLILHNSVFDCFMTFNNFGVQLIDSTHTDTMILGHVLNENRSNKLKDRGAELFGDDAKLEQTIMKESVSKNGGQLTEKNYEMYKADADLLAHYGAKDALLTLKLFYNDVPILFESKLDRFFYEEESMPLLRKTTYDLNTIGLRVDPIKLQNLRGELEAECEEAKSFILRETWEYVKEKYPKLKKKDHFSIDSNQQLSWLLFEKLEVEPGTLTDGGKKLCKALDMRVPYSWKGKREFMQMCRDGKGQAYVQGCMGGKKHIHDESCFDPVTKKKKLAKKFKDPWVYMTCNEEVLTKPAEKYKWVARLLAYKKNQKLLNTYISGIQERMTYNVIRPTFLQHGTTSGRYSSKDPNFQNLPREDKRIKSCIIARPGKVFIGADYSQLEPRVFASFSGDTRLQECFANGEDFYSVIGTEVFNKSGCSLIKDDDNSFAKLYPEERQLAKTFSLAVTYGATPFRLAKTTGKSIKETEEIVASYFKNFPSVYDMMLKSYEEVMEKGQVENLFGRPRRMPEAKLIKGLFGDEPHSSLPYEYRNLLNLGVNHRIQSTAASIVNRSSIAFYEGIQAQGIKDCYLTLQVHDSLMAECKEEDAEQVAIILKFAMENTTHLSGVQLVADPIISNNLADLK